VNFNLIKGTKLPSALVYVPGDSGHVSLVWWKGVCGYQQLDRIRAVAVVQVRHIRSTQAQASGGHPRFLFVWLNPQVRDAKVNARDEVEPHSQAAQAAACC
jgi:hypothetical protein